MDDKKLKYINRIRTLLSSPDHAAKIEAIRQELTAKQIYIYGAGNAGNMTFQLLQDQQIPVAGFFDRRGGKDVCYCDKPVYKADRAELAAKSGKESLIIIAFLCGISELNDIRSSLWAAGWERIYYYHDIHYFRQIYESVAGDKKDNFPVEFKGKILEAAGLMEDEESFEVIEKFLTAIIRVNPELFSLPTEKPQYFVDDVPFQKGYARFIDCGAFDGDTALALKRYKGEVDALVLFEPDPDNFIKLCEKLRQHRAAKEQVLFPCGVWKNSEMLKFRSGVKSLSEISEQGDTFVQCVAIDEVIGDFAPTFIKMDIEGAEWEAVTGAQQTIRKYGPDLAISVYHRIEHLWEIPLFIKEIAPEYRFYLRCHGLHGMETILYAVQGEKKEMELLPLWDKEIKNEPGVVTV